MVCLFNNYVCLLLFKALIEAEVGLCAEQLLNGLDHYKKPNAPALKKLKASKEVKGSSMNFVMELSKYLVHIMTSTVVSS